MAKKKDKSIVLISHQERIMKMADEIIVIADGNNGWIHQNDGERI